MKNIIFYFEDDKLMYKFNMAHISNNYIISNFNKKTIEYLKSSAKNKYNFITFISTKINKKFGNHKFGKYCYDSLLSEYDNLYYGFGTIDDRIYVYYSIEHIEKDFGKLDDCKQKLDDFLKLHFPSNYKRSIIDKLINDIKKNNPNITNCKYYNEYDDNQIIMNMMIIK